MAIADVVVVVVVVMAVVVEFQYRHIRQSTSIVTEPRHLRSNLCNFPQFITRDFVYTQDERIVCADTAADT